MKTQGEQVDCMARSGLYHSRPASITSYTNELNTSLNKQIKHKIIKTLKHIQHYVSREHSERICLTLLTSI